MKGLRRLIQSVKSFIGLKVSGTLLKKRKDDVFLISYPKSGNTWMRFIIGALSGDEIDFVNMEDLIPDIYANSKKKLDSMSSQRTLKSHEMWRNEIDYSKVIYIYRSPFDVCVSYYHWYRKYAPEQFETFDAFFESFIEDDLPHGGWGEHFQSWIDFGERFPGRIFFVSYEDLRSNTFQSIKNITSFLKLNVDDNKIIKAIEYSSFSNMQKMEQEQKDKSELFKRSKNKEVSFVRKGKGNYLENYSDEQVIRIKNKFHNLLEKYGY